MNGKQAPVAITGVGFAVEDFEAGEWRSIRRVLTSAGLADSLCGFDPHARFAGRDAKLLGHEDILPLQAARAAIECALGGRIPTDRRWALVTFTTSKLTPTFELALPFVKLRKPDESIDTVALSEHIASGAVEVNPLDLLRTLDNSVSWWLCKTYGFGDAHLQLGQTLAPDFWALIAALELVIYGEYDGVLVGGGQTSEQASILAAGYERASLMETDPHLCGAASFFVVERESFLGDRRGLGRISLHLEHLSTDGAPSPDGPTIASALALLHAIGAAAVGEPGMRRIGNGAIAVERMCR
jgi:hypothetical protein